jgi:uncharacterized repeat protein (TIGR01451 family)
VTNNGNLTVTGLTVTDTAFSGTGTPPVVTCPTTTLAPGGTTTCTGTYTVTQADKDAGADITDTAVARGTATGAGFTGPVTSNFADAIVTIDTAATLDLAKSVTPSTVTAPGQTVTYSFLATNTGSQALHGVSITDASFSGTGTLSPIVCPITTLAPGESTTCTATYTVTQADADAGAVDNTATANGLNPAGDSVASPPSSAVLSVAASGALTLTKTVDPTVVSAAGQVVSYRLVVTNNGGFTITGVAAKDTSFSGTGTPPTFTCPSTPLASGASTTCTGRYTVTAADLGAADITDTALATGTGPGGQTVTSNPATATVTSAGRLGLTKTGTVIDVNHNRRTDAGDRIHWTLTVTNLGTTTLHDVTVSDPSTGPATCPSTTLAPGQSMTCTVRDHTITAADVNAGRVTNTATATGKNPEGVPISSGAVSATVNIPRAGLAVTGADFIGLLMAGGTAVVAGLLVTMLSLVRRNRRPSR